MLPFLLCCFFISCLPTPSLGFHLIHLFSTLGGATRLSGRAGASYTEVTVLSEVVSGLIPSAGSFAACLSALLPVYLLYLYITLSPASYYACFLRPSKAHIMTISYIFTYYC